MVNKIGVIGMVIGVAILIAVIYLSSASHGVGVFVSCNNSQIIDIRNVPPPLMAVYQTEFCKVNVTAYYPNGTLICENYGSIVGSDSGVIECDNLKYSRGDQINVNALFYNLSGTQIGSDSKTLLVNP